MNSSSRVGNSIRRNFASALFGNTIYRLSQWLLIVVIARCGDVEMVGSFALAQAISAPVFLAVGLNLRVARATDVQGHWSAGQYHGLRFILNALSLALSGAIAWVATSSASFAFVTLALALSKASETSSQLSYGYYQLRERLDVMSRSLILRTFTGTAPFAIVLIQTSDLAMACLALALGWAFVTLVHDRPQESRLRTEAGETGAQGAEGATMLTLAKEAAPLGVTAGVTSVTQNIPRYIIQLSLGHAALGLFAALDYLRRVITMITSSLGDSLIARLARTAQSSRPRAFMCNILFLGGFGAAVSLVVIALAAVFGAPLTRLALGHEYVNQPVLLTLLAGTIFINFQTILSKGLQGGRQFREMFRMNLATAAGTVAFGAIAIPLWGLVGAAATLGVGYFVGCLLGAFYLRRMVLGMVEPQEAPR